MYENTLVNWHFKQRTDHRARAEYGALGNNRSISTQRILFKLSQDFRPNTLDGMGGRIVIKEFLPELWKL